ncbi:MAG TPA: sugar kinase, partial [Candidatus Kapabacteria bacterium]|nr:sugar kinase [Candidatus Kapabacteria bacterium]
TGEDIFQRDLLHEWKSEKIDLSCAKKLHDRRNGLYFVQTDSNGERHFQYYRKNSAATQTLNKIPVNEIVSYASRAKVFFFSAITLAVMEHRERITAIVKQLYGKTIIAFDTNYRAVLWRSEKEYRNAVEQILPYIDIILPTDTDERLLHTALRGADIPIMYGNKNIICAMKSGRRGAFIIGGWLVRATKIKPVDTTGAGDAFNAGFLTGLLWGYSPEAAAKLGNDLAGIVIRHRGAIVEKKIFLREMKKLKIV